MHSGLVVLGECNMYKFFDVHLLRDPAVWNNAVFLKVKHLYSHNKCRSSACHPEMGSIVKLERQRLLSLLQP